MRFLPKETVESFRAKYIGKTIKINHLFGEEKYSGNRYDGRTGVCDFVDDSGQLHGSWGGLGIQPEHDDIEIIG